MYLTFDLANFYFIKLVLLLVLEHILICILEVPSKIQLKISSPNDKYDGTQKDDNETIIKN